MLYRVRRLVLSITRDVFSTETVPAKQELHGNREKAINEDYLLHLSCYPHLFSFSFRNNNLFIGPGIYKRNREMMQAEKVTT